jgi:hypothetical protein
MTRSREFLLRVPRVPRVRVGALALAGILAGACSSSSSSSSSGGTSGTAVEDGGAPPPPPGTNEAKQTGRILRAQSTEGVSGAVVAVAGKTATTGANGDYEIVVPQGTPYQMLVTADGFWKLREQEWILKQPSLARGDTNVILTQTAGLLADFLDGRKKEKGTVVVKVEVMAPCTSEAGATLTIDPPGEAKLSYFTGQIPDSQATSVQKGSTFSGVFYNVEIGVPLKVTITSPTCKQVPFPVDADDVTYTGITQADADESISYERVFLRDPAGDGGK